LPGASLSIGASQVVTLSYSPQAGRSRIFAGAGSVTFTAAALADAFPEWWGAKTGGTDCVAGITAAVASGMKRLLFASGAYTVLSTVTLVGYSYYELVGMGRFATQIIGSNLGTYCLMRIGGAAAVSQQSDVTVRNLAFIAGGVCSGTNPGFQIQYLTRPTITEVTVYNFTVGVYMLGNFDTFLDTVTAYTGNSTIANVYGFYVDGATQNGSVDARRCISSHYGFTGTGASYGWYTTGADISDQFVLNSEFDLCSYGVYIDGSAATQNAFSLDLHFTNIICDQCKVAGIVVNGLQVNAGMCEINGGWFAPSAAAATAVNLLNSSGVIVRGMQIYSVGTTSLAGINLTGSTNCIVSQNILKGQFTNGMALQNGSTGNIIENNQFTTTGTVAGNAAVVLVNSDHNNISHNSIARVGAVVWASGITVATASDYCNVIGNIIPTAAATTRISLGANANCYSVGTAG